MENHIIDIFVESKAEHLFFVGISGIAGGIQWGMGAR
jgi:hypothetical protein